jgi:WXG100 family type VII secretion target
MAQMMTDGFDVHSSQLMQKRQQVAQMVTRIQGQLGTLDTQLQTLFKQWVGQSSTGFNTLHANWQQQYQDLNKQLGVIGQNLETTQKTYVNADVNNTPTAR